MVASYQFSERVNTQVILWGAVRGVVVALRMIVAVVATLPALWVRVGLAGQAFADDAALFLAGLWVALGWCVGLALAVGAVALLLANPVIILAGLGIVAFGWVTYPRSRGGR